MPRERKPASSVLTDEPYQALLSVIGAVNWRADSPAVRLATVTVEGLVLPHTLGRRA